MKMKQILFKTIACCAVLLAFVACDKSDDLLDDGTGSGSIFLNLSSNEVSALSSRAFDTSFETRVDHLDVLIFDEADNKVCYESFETGAAATGKITLKAKRSNFVANKGYWVYLIANANDDEKTRFSAADFDLNAFKSMVRNNPYIHLTGIKPQSEQWLNYDLPQNFLMDGVAYDAKETEPDEPGKVVLNNGNAKDDTNLKVNLRRAAVKLVLNIKPKEVTAEDPSVIKFIEPIDFSGVTNTSGYYLRNMPHSTLLLPPTQEGFEALLRTPYQTRNHYFEVHSSGVDPDEPAEDPNNLPQLIDKITITAYVYSHNWTTGSNMVKEPRWIVDIPLKYDNGSKDRELATYEHSYYQIPVCKGTELKRNTCYTVNVVISAPGGTAPSQEAELTNVEYEVLDWIDKPIQIGGEDSRPMFLTLNRSEMEMHNIDTDNKTMEFASSSKVTATVKEAYFIDKFGNKQNVSEPIFNEIKITPDSELNGKIKIESPVPTNDTARYIVVDVKNDDGITRTVTIIQYPVINITNIQGYYSYRSDFGGTTWESYENPTHKRVTAYGYDEATDTWKYSGTDRGRQLQEYLYDENGTGKWYWTDPLFFTSKVAEQINDGDDKGKSKILYYYYDPAWVKDENGRWVITPGNKLSTLSLSTKAMNARMYHVHVTATSKDYTIGRPRITTSGITDPGVDNAKLVSPSFMIASQLGAVYNVESRAMAASHCKEYVEVAKDGTVYDDWRLPTSAEISIIMERQYIPNAALDEVMAGRYYYSASELVENTTPTETDNDLAIRCVRDSYENSEPGKDAGTTTETASGNQ